MTNGQNAADRLDAGSKVYSVDVHAKVQSGKSCSFCWFVLHIYPTLRGMSPRDQSTYKVHLEKAHGLRDEIQP